LPEKLKKHLVKSNLIWSSYFRSGIIYEKQNTVIIKDNRHMKIDNNYSIINNQDLIKYFQTRQEISAVYLFGSCVEGRHNSMSDAEHLIQTTIQGLTDIAGFITGRRKFRSPKNSIDIIEILFENNLLIEDQKKLFQKIIRFRNIVVHLYNGVNEKMVFDILQNNLEDLKIFFQVLKNLI
jgi:uncharacterized protein YutE (UPF0331/DUF86 family)